MRATSHEHMLVYSDSRTSATAVQCSAVHLSSAQPVSAHVEANHDAMISVFLALKPDAIARFVPGGRYCHLGDSVNFTR